MLEDVLEAATASEVFDGILVATNCEEAVPIIRRKGVLHLQTSEELGLNHAAREAADWLLNKNIGCYVSVPCRHPIGKSIRVSHLVSCHSDPRGMTIVPSHDKGGTNCLILSPPNLLPFCFGADSYAKHLRQGLKLNLSCRTKFSDGIGLDIDTPCDLRAISMRPKQTLTQNYLEKIENPISAQLTFLVSFFPARSTCRIYPVALCPAYPCQLLNFVGRSLNSHLG